MINRETVKREGKIILICIAISFVFRLWANLVSAPYETLVNQLQPVVDKQRLVDKHRLDSMNKIEDELRIKDPNALIVTHFGTRTASDYQLERYKEKTWSSKDKNVVQLRLLFGLMLFVYSVRGAVYSIRSLKTVIADDISQEKKIVAFLSLWSFGHLLAYFGTKGRGARDELWPFYCFWNTPLGEVYDFTELFFYVGGGWLIFFLYYYLKEDNKA